MALESLKEILPSAGRRVFVPLLAALSSCAVMNVQQEAKSRLLQQMEVKKEGTQPDGTFVVCVEAMDERMAVEFAQKHAVAAVSSPDEVIGVQTQTREVTHGAMLLDKTKLETFYVACTRATPPNRKP